MKKIKYSSHKYNLNGGAELNKSINELNIDLNNTYNESIIFMKNIINELNMLNNKSNKFTGKTKGQFNQLNSKLKQILENITNFKNKYEQDITNKQLSSYDQYINQVNSIQKFVADTFNETSLNDYLTLKLSESPVFVKEQIDVKKISEPLETIVKEAGSAVNNLENKINNGVIDGSRETIIKEIEILKNNMKTYDNEINKVKEINK
jgi:hypothetical protein